MGGSSRRSFLLLCFVGAAIAGCGGGDERDGQTPKPASSDVEEQPNESGSPRILALPTAGDWLADITAEVGLDFRHTTGATGRYYFPEIAGSGCAMFDFDGDGDLDVYAIQAFPLEQIDGKADAWKADGPDNAGANRLFRNDLTIHEDGSRTLRFVDVTAESGVGDRGYGMGCAVGDYDNDGDLDLYITNFGPNVLYRNNGDGTFDDASDQLPPEHRWSTSATFFDYNGDGALDLFVTNYVNFSMLENKICHSPSGRRDYCGPASFQPLSDRLFRNNGDGTFIDVTTQANIHSAFGSGLGVVSADFNGDDWPDLYVANDGDANQLWTNNGDGTFENTALLAGAAYNAVGMAEAGMGVTAGDFDQDGDPDIFLSHLLGETNTFLVNDGDGVFEDATDVIAAGVLTHPYTGFGAHWFDVDNDGPLDLFIANGAVKLEEKLAGDPYPYGNPNQLLRNLGPPNHRFRDVSDRAGAANMLLEASRGAAFGDIDNDGDTDILVSNSNGPLRLFQNTVGQARAWIGLDLRGAAKRPHAVGALVRLDRQGGARLVRRVHTDGSYLAASDPRVLFGLGDDRGVQSVIVFWPGGLIERFSDLDVERYHELRQGEGRRLDRAPDAVTSTGTQTASNDSVRPQPPPTNDDDALPAIPDLSLETMEPTVRAQFVAALDRAEANETDAAAAGELGMLCMAYEFYRLAEPCLKRAARLDPEDYRWRHLLGIALVENGRFEAAARVFEALLEARGDSLPVLLYQGDVQRTRNNLKAAEDLYRRALAMAPNEPHAQCGLGQVLARSGRDDEAIARLDEAIRLAPDFGKARYLRGLALRRLGRTDEAAAELDRAEPVRDVQPPFPDTLAGQVVALATGAIDALHRAIEMMQAGDFTGAMVKLRESIRIDPSQAESHAQLGAALLQTGQPREAEASLRQALTIDPDFADARYNLGVLLNERDDIAGAVEQFEHAVRVREDMFEAHMGLGTCLPAIGRTDEAAGHLVRAKSLRPEDARVYKRLARTYEKLRRCTEAVDVLREGWDRLPGDLSIADRLAWALATSPDASVRDAEESLQIASLVCDRTNRRIPLALDTLAAAYALNGRFEQAIQAADEAIQGAEARGDAELAAAVRDRQARYRQRETYVQDNTG